MRNPFEQILKKFHYGSAVFLQHFTFSACLVFRFVVVYIFLPLCSHLLWFKSEIFLFLPVSNNLFYVLCAPHPGGLIPTRILGTMPGTNGNTIRKRDSGTNAPMNFHSIQTIVFPGFYVLTFSKFKTILYG